MAIVSVDRLERVDAWETGPESRKAREDTQERRIEGRQTSIADSAPLKWFIYGDRAELPRPKPSIVPDGWQIAVKAIGFWALIAGFYYGPPYATCWHMKRHGMFWSHTTMSTCVAEKMAERDTWLDTVAKSVWPTT